MTWRVHIWLKTPTLTPMMLFFKRELVHSCFANHFLTHLPTTACQEFNITSTFSWQLKLSIGANVCLSMWPFDNVILTAGISWDTPPPHWDRYLQLTNDHVCILFIYTFPLFSAFVKLQYPPSVFRNASSILYVCKNVTFQIYSQSGILFYLERSEK